MYNQTEAILSQYELEINEVTKGRGTYICDTDKGLKVLVPFSGSKEKGEFLKTFLEELQKKGFLAEQIYANKEEAALTQEEGCGEGFILKDHITGTELNTNRPGEMREAARLLASYQSLAKNIDLPLTEQMKKSAENVVEKRKKHYRELVKVKNYIRGRKGKNEFEQIYMKNYLPMLATAQESIAILEKQEEMTPECCICHGEFNQHNAILSGEGWRIINFENFFYSWSTMDLANFLRKMEEKNQWDIDLGKELIEAYDEICPLGKDGRFQLYGLLLFPEKFWKVTNHYMSSRKSWISGRDIEKLQTVIEQENLRLKFMENLFSNLS